MAKLRGITYCEPPSAEGPGGFLGRPRNDMGLKESAILMENAYTSLTSRWLLHFNAFEIQAYDSIINKHLVAARCSQNSQPRIASLVSE
jgi:hypothetical protein